MIEEKRCLNCRYFTSEYLYDVESDVGECIRFPPHYSGPRDVEDHDRAAATAFPVLSYVRVCGEWVSDAPDYWGNEWKKR